MGLNNTPRANRLHIGIFGRRNAGKSSLINALTGQNLAIVSDTPGTTADPVFKSMELHPIGPVVFIDTAGFDDEGELGQLRVARTEDIINRTDIAVLVIDGCVLTPQDISWRRLLRDAGVPTITVFGKSDTLTEAQRSAAAQDAEDAIFVSTKTGEGIDLLRTAIINTVPEEYMQEQLLDGLIEDSSLVLLVMPQDIQAPKGRLILPQVQTIRELLDRRCTVVSTTADGYEAALARLNCPPDLIITDSQCFSHVYEKKPDASALTSFSILMAAAKGDLDVFIEGVSTIDKALHADRNSAAISQARSTFRVLIAEACTHVPLQEDIGTIKIPMLLRKQFGDQVEVTNVRGNDFPSTDELKQYDLIIHCGACMFNRRHVLSRIAAAQEAGVPITNYGIFLAFAAGILDKIQF